MISKELKYQSLWGGIILLFVLSGCTVVKHDEKAVLDKKTEDELEFFFQDGTFDAVEYVDEIWDKKVLPEYRINSSSMEEVLVALDENWESAGKKYGNKAEVESPYIFKVHGRGKIVEANTKSAASTVTLLIEGYSGNQTVLMQIGPVIKLTAVRDSLGFISFGDFTNQMEYAGVSKELNFKVRDTVLTVLDRDNLVGIEVEFSAAFIYTPNKPILMTPVILGGYTP